MLKMRILTGSSTASNWPSFAATTCSQEVPWIHWLKRSSPVGNFTSGWLIKLADSTPNKVGSMEPVGILNGWMKNVRMAMATETATRRTSTFSRQEALGYGLSHLLADFS